jgi:hypothetical protein
MTGAGNNDSAAGLKSDLESVLTGLGSRLPLMRSQWAAAQPFHYVIIDDFLPNGMAAEIHAAYPPAVIDGWDNATYTHQKKKLTMRSGFAPPIDRFFHLCATTQFRDLLTDITAIPHLLDDPELVGGGLHQIVRGGFLDLHVDYNFHPHTKLHRRLNLLVYMNKEWRPEYQGYLELWDWTQQKRQLESVAPLFNRAVLFETNEISVHGHPKPLAVPPQTTRKSLALYYYTAQREIVAPEHNTLYHQSTGVRGYVKTAISSAQAAAERIRDKGPMFVARDVAHKVRRRVLGLPPVNR